MLPRPAIANAMAQAAQPPVAPDALAPRRVPAAELIANLRAAVLLRLIETLLKQVQRTENRNGPAGALLEALIEALKSPPAGRGGRGDGVRDIAAILSRLPPQVRPAVERLLHQAITALPTRVLMEILHDPEGPAAQKLASATMLLSVPEADKPPAERSRALAALEVRLAESRAEQRSFPRRENVLRGDARALQAELSRLFEPDASRLAEAGPMAGRALSARHDVATRPVPRPVEPASHAGTMLTGGSPEPAEAEARLVIAGRPVIAAAENAEPVTTRSIPQATGDGVEAVMPARSAETIDADVQASELPEAGRRAEPAASAHGGAAAPVRARPEAIAHFITAVVARLTDAETGTLKALLEKPLVRPAGNAAATATADRPEPIDAGEHEQQTRAAARTTEETTARLPSAAEERPATSERVTPSTLRDGPASLPDLRLEPAGPPVAMRETVVPAFVPYLPTEDEMAEGNDEASGSRDDEDERDEAAEGDQGDPATGEEGFGGEDAKLGEDAATAERRGRIADLVGPPDPGFAFYQKLGEYWT